MLYEMNNDKPIGIFDSGLGGLTAVKELIKTMPNEDIIYFGDTGRVPYGRRSNGIIRKYAFQDIAFLMSLGVKMVVAACGTVSSVITGMEEQINIPFSGVVRPTAIAAINITKNKRIGVIGTTATIKSSSYKKEINCIDPNIEVFQQDCSLFVPLVEDGVIDPDDIVIRTVARRYLEPLRKENIDTLILGCTHYPIISKVISDIMGDSVNLISSGRETALFVQDFINENGIKNKKTSAGKYSFYVSDNIEKFYSIANLFLDKDISNDVRYVDIDLY